MIAPNSFPSTFDGQSSQWQMVAPQSYYYGAHYDHLHAAAAAFAAQSGYNPAAYAHGHAPFYPSAQPLQHDAFYHAHQQHQQQYVAQAPPAEQARSRFAFAHAPQAYEPRFNLPPPAMHAMQHRYAGADEYAPYGGHAESASRATLDSEHLRFLVGRLTESADALSSDEYDRSAHRADAAMQVDEPQPQQQPITYDLIPNVSAVPPPPPIERSAVPLADLATEMIWEACRQGYLRVADLVNAAAAAAPLGASVLGQSVRSGPRRSGEFGAIGSGRVRTASCDGYDSSSSSPASSMPGTPMGVEAVEDAAARRQRLAGLGLGSFEENAAKAYAFGGVRGRSSRSNLSPFPAEPSAAFRQFVKQVLTATLVAPEDIVMALYLVSQIPVDKIIPPTAAEPGQDAQTTSFKAAPFKIMLGSLIIANKMAQDNSYRNSSWASVSGIPLADVNTLEAHVFAALGFSADIKEDKWQAWLGVVVDRFRSGKGKLGDVFAAQDALERLVRASLRHAPSPLPSSPVLAPVAECPSTPLNPSAAAYIDLDASGPLESPMRPADLRRAATAAAAAATRPAPQRPTLLGFPTAPAVGQDSPLVGRSRACRGDSAMTGYASLFPPVDFGASRSRSFGQEIPRNAIC
ncbi:hypothetical protein JCM10207_005957 [Rhodosporidiobolus poonsookiae]